MSGILGAQVGRKASKMFFLRQRQNYFLPFLMLLTNISQIKCSIFQVVVLFYSMKETRQTDSYASRDKDRAQ